MVAWSSKGSMLLLILSAPLFCHWLLLGLCLRGLIACLYKAVAGFYTFEQVLFHGAGADLQFFCYLFMGHAVDLAQ